MAADRFGAGDGHFDCIIVGAGAAGCVLAARLSQDGVRRVLLLEAGPDMPPGSEPAAVLDPYPGALFGEDFNWPGLTAEVFPANARRAAVRRALIQGKVVGGGSTINGMMAQRGLPRDFEVWEAMGAAGWGWQDVLPRYKALETDHDFSGELHGGDGPIPTRREGKADWGPFARAVTEAMIGMGYPYFEDSNADFRDGISPVSLNNLPTRRVSSAMGYLDAEARRRPNLHIIAHALVSRLLFEGTRCVGVEALVEGRTRTFRARETVVSCGAVFSPALLLRSGVGPARELEALGIPLVADRPGVGKNLRNHSMIHVATHLRRGAVQDPRLASWAFTFLRYSSGYEGCTPGDMQIFPINRTAWHPLGARIGAIGLCLYQPFSIGEVRLRQADPHTMPSVRFNMLVDERDVERLADGLKMVLELFADPGVARLTNEVFLPDKAAAGRMASPTASNRLKTTLINTLFSAGAPIRKAILGKAVLDVRALLNDRELLREIVRRENAHVHHVCGTCKIGAAADPMAVVDPGCRVYGVEGLRVADASIMPRNISSSVHLTVMMIGEKAAAIMARS